MPTYEEFFNVGGPLWPHTLLLDFESLQAGIDSFCHRIGVPNSKPLPAINQNPNGVRDIQRYRDEAGPPVSMWSETGVSPSLATPLIDRRCGFVDPQGW